MVHNPGYICTVVCRFYHVRANSKNGPKCCLPAHPTAGKRHSYHSYYSR